MSPLIADGMEPAQGFPRVSGDEPTVYTSGIKKTAFSPRERG